MIVIPVSHPMSLLETKLRDAEGFAILIAAMSRQIAEGRSADVLLRLVGIRTRGFSIAERLAQSLIPLVGDAIPVGAIDITLYRDDLDKAQRWPVLRGTEIPFDVDGAEIVLVDDVLFSGRTVRAALNVICDLGRPARVRLATLVDRGHREFPIQPDVVGLTLQTDLSELVRVQMTPVDPVDEIIRISSRPKF